MPYVDLSIYAGDWSLLFLRIVLAVIFLVHGSSKWALWRVAPSDQMPTNMLIKMRLLSIVEPLGALGILLGLFTEYAAGVIGLVMLAALYYKIIIWKKKFDGDGGWEIDLLILAVCFTLMALGPGVLSLTGLY